MKKTIIALIMVLAFITMYVVVSGPKEVLALDNMAEENLVYQSSQYQQSQQSFINYYHAYALWQQTENDGHLSFSLHAENLEGGKDVSILDSFGYAYSTKQLEPNDSITMYIDVESKGLYQLYLDYYVLEQSRMTPNIQVLINDDVQYTEMNAIDLFVNWKKEDQPQYDRYGDELTPKSYIHAEWFYEKGLEDPNFFYTEPLKFLLEAGQNKITITVNEGYILLGKVLVENKKTVFIDYQAYISQYDYVQGANNITLEAEDYTLKNRRNISAQYRQDASVTPFSYKNRILNTINGSNYQNAGDTLTYNFHVEESGLYHITIKYMHTGSTGMPTHRQIQINGDVLFSELNYYAFPFSTKWRNETLKDENGNPYAIYLEKGMNSISLKVTNEEVAPLYHHLLSILEMMSDISLDVKKITGGLVDKDRDWKITTYITDLEERLQAIDESLTVAIHALETYTKDKKLPYISQLTVARKIIRDFIKKPEELPGYMNRFEGSDSSAYAKINLVIPQLLSQPLYMDKLYVHQETKVPKANANIFKRISVGFRAFMYSFFDPKYNQKQDIDKDTITLWVNKSRIYMELMQRMIDESFTPNTGIKVQLSLMPDESKIILSNAAGTTPDAVLGLSSSKPFEFALRGIIEDLTTYEGFYELAEQYNANTFIPYVFESGVYAIPETQDVALLFYRKDIFDQLNILPPDTWEDVINLLPVIQKYDMNFYSPLGNNNSFKGFGQTTPLIYQNQGALYDQETMTTIVNQGGSYRAFELMTDLFTVHNLPIQTSNFFQHFRTGKIPVGIMGAGTYIQLKYAAPEIAGLWGVLPVPGFENEDGVVERWDPTFGQSSVILSDSEKKDKAWELIKWWHSKETQVDFSFEIQSTLGDRFLYMTANLEAFKESAWPSDSKNIVLSQWQWIRSTGKVPGDYMLERELSNAWNRTVLDGMNPRISIDKAIVIVNNEIKRKLIEFGYMDDNGNIIKPYIIPTHENIEQWVRR